MHDIMKGFLNDSLIVDEGMPEFEVDSCSLALTYIL